MGLHMASNGWVSVDDALERNKDFFNTKKALQYHLARRHMNGLERLDAVRKTPIGTLIVHLPRFRSWLLAEPRQAA
jgi:hypothetical protein